MKKICILSGIMMALLITGLLVKDKKVSMQQDLADSVLRFHVLANSDSKEDQELKMQVKEAVLSYMKEELPKSNSVAATRSWASAHTMEIERLAEQLISEKGYDYSVKAEVTTCMFPEKTYGDITFPSGEYEALRIEIGKAKGQNWWCVLYPNLCFIDAVHAVVPEEGKTELKEVLEEDTYEMVTAKPRFKIKWLFFR